MNRSSLGNRFQWDPGDADHVVVLVGFAIELFASDRCLVVEDEDLKQFSFEVADGFGVEVHLVGVGVVELRVDAHAVLRVAVIESIELIEKERFDVPHTLVGSLQVLAPDHADGH